MDKLKKSLFVNKKIFVFLICLSLIGVVFGSLLPVFMSENDKTLVSEYMISFVENIKNNNDYLNVFVNCVFSSVGFSILVWLLGVSIIGVPLILFMFFSKCFVLGFSITSIILNYGIKGSLFSFAYIFPHQIIYILIYSFLTNYSLVFSVKFIFYIFNKVDFNLKLSFNRYLKKLGICLCLLVLCCLFETFVHPFIMNFVFKFLGI